MTNPLLTNVLPAISAAVHPLTFPINGTKVTFRPYTVGDEKLLLAAAASRNDRPDFYVSNTMKVIRSCIDDREGLLEKLPSVDVEFLLLHIRAKSVGETASVRYKDGDKVLEIELDLEQFRVDIDPEHQYKIELTDQVGLQMKDISFADKISYAAKFNDNNKTDVIFQTIADCVHSIYNGENIYVVGQDCTTNDVLAFIEQLSGISDKLYKFVATMPQLAIDFKHPTTGKTVTLKGNEIDFLALSPATST